MKYKPNLDIEKIKAVREERSCGMLEAKAICIREEILKDIELLRSPIAWVDFNMLDILEYLIEHNHIRF